MKFNKKQTIVCIAALALVLCFTVGGTLAYITATTDPVVNTFTIGDIKLTLTETETNFKMVPGNTIAKDPVVKVEKGSESCWVFVKIDESQNLTDYISYEIADGWTRLDGTQNVYYTIADPSEQDGVSFHVLKGDTVTVKTSVTKEMMTALGSNLPTLTFTAYAVQKANIGTAAAAWALLSSTPYAA